MIAADDNPLAALPDWEEYSWDEASGEATFSRWDPETRSNITLVHVHRRWWLSKEERAALRY